VPGDVRDTSVSDQDLAVQSAKQKLALLKERPGYVEALRIEPASGVGRAVMIGVAAACGGISYACKLYVTAAWLMWFLIVLFGAFALFSLLAAIGFSPKLAGEKWGVAVVEKRIAGDKHRIAFLRENGDRHELTVSENLYGLLKAGDVGVVHCTGTAPDYTVDSFERL
jgi:hypothetical protein